MLPLCINPRLAEAAHHDHAQHVAPGWIDLFLDLSALASSPTSSLNAYNAIQRRRGHPQRLLERS